MPLIQTATKMINCEEGWSSVPYYCSKHYPSIGIGRKIGNQYEPLPNITTTRGIEDEYLSVTIQGLIDSFNTHINTRDIFPSLSEIRQSVLVCMAYQMGFAGVLEFRQMLAALKRNDFECAANEILNSEFHSDTPARCEREAKMMNLNIMDSCYEQ